MSEDLDSIEYARRVGAKVERWLAEGSTLSWSEMVERAGDEVMAEAEAAE